jgi:hypothetical protein
MTEFKERLLLTYSQAAKLLGCSVTLISEYEKYGLKVYIDPARKDKGKFVKRIYIEDLKQFISDNTYLFNNNFEKTQKRFNLR